MQDDDSKSSDHEDGEGATADEMSKDGEEASGDVGGLGTDAHDNMTEDADEGLDYRSLTHI